MDLLRKYEENSRGWMGFRGMDYPSLLKQSLFCSQIDPLPRSLLNAGVTGYIIMPSLTEVFSTSSCISL